MVECFFEVVVDILVEADFVVLAEVEELSVCDLLETAFLLVKEAAFLDVLLTVFFFEVAKVEMASCCCMKGEVELDGSYQY